MNKFDIVLLAAGLSERMGKLNKMILPFGERSLCAHSAIEALKFLSSLQSGGNLIIVAGYEKEKIINSLEPCILFVQKSACNINLTITENPNYKEGQFGSVKVGVKEVRKNAFFFISLADMPFITDKCYKKLSDQISKKQQNKAFYAVRPFYKDFPGHPVLFFPEVKEKLLQMPDGNNLRDMLNTCNTLKIQTDNNFCVKDIDNYQDYLDALQMYESFPENFL